MKMQPLLLIVGSLLTVLTAGGCHVISEEARSSVVPPTVYEEARENPANHRGESLLLGGLILGHRVDEGRSTLEIMRWDLNFQGEPIAVDEKGNRFLLRSEPPLDPAFGPGRLVTLVGTVSGAETHPLGENDYLYPILRLKEIHLWDTPFRYGIHRAPSIYLPFYVEPPGRTNPYDPSFYTYPYTHYWMRPLAE